MRLALATINFHDVLCRNARESYEDAARRWGAEFIELTEENMPAGIPFQMGKTIIFDFAPWADRVIYIDGGDTIIRGDAPSPFNVCPPDKLGAVEVGCTASPNWPRFLSERKGAWRRLNRRLGQAIPFTDFYFNAGVLVLTRDAHQRLLKRALELSRLLGRLVGWDEIFLNYAVIELGVPVQMMDRTWNMQQPSDARASFWMDGCIYHYPSLGQRYSIMPVLNWRDPGPPGRAAGPAKQSRMSRLLQFLRCAPVLGPTLRYLYWWLSLPVKINRLSDQVTEVNHMLKGLYLRLGERARSEKPRPPDRRP